MILDTLPVHDLIGKLHKRLVQVKTAKHFMVLTL